MEVPYMFRSRRPPKKEVYSKLTVLLGFFVFCVFVGFTVSDLSLPKGGGVDDGAAEEQVPDPNGAVPEFPTFSPEERAKLLEVTLRVGVPYLDPWGGEERPAVFFLWHLLYRSIKSDLNVLAARKNHSGTTTTASPTAADDAAAAVSPPHTALQLVIHVVETEEGYITTSLAKFLPEAHVFSVIVNASVVVQPGTVASVRGEADAAAERQTLAELVAAKVERVLGSSTAEHKVESMQPPGLNGVQLIWKEGTTTTTTTVAVTGEAQRPKEGDAGTTTAAPDSSHLYLCVPTHHHNSSYYAAAVAQNLRVNYQVILFPYVALRDARTSAEFDAILRHLAAQANVASFIALPLLYNIGTGAMRATGAGPDASPPSTLSPSRTGSYNSQELIDYDRWYGQDGARTPVQVLQRALHVPEMEAEYDVIIVPLGQKRWAGALRQLVRVELRKKSPPRAAVAGDAATLSTTTSTTADPAGVVKPIETSPFPPHTLAEADGFGCAARQSLLGCASRARHSMCDVFLRSSVA
ncbi:hypothetical protein NESM_000022200 [Novymonas esmeraldas]|uniref:Uncharacterized protein n=1 Tax=Novymonas esmeraldas TaxID=1808958 RepID=A0AAW0F3B6_9TRYP